MKGDDSQAVGFESPLTLIVVDDTAIYRQMLRNIFREVPGVEVVGAARSGEEALELIGQHEPDLITLDVQMPGMTGIEVLRELKSRRSRTKAIMVSSQTGTGTQATMDALLEGAFDFILKPNSSDAEANRKQLLESLTEKTTAFRESSSRLRARRSIAPRADSSQAVTLDAPPSRYEAVVIGTSTGGPVALREVIPLLPADLSVPVFVVQHMPPKYTQSLAERLNGEARLKVVEATDLTHPQPGVVYIAPGGQQMKVIARPSGAIIRITDDPPEHGCRPGVDYLFRSAAEAYDGKLLAVILTGMGKDGTEGCRQIKRRGGYVVAQHSQGCTVYGMPKSVVDEGLADKIIPLELIAGGIAKLVRVRH